MAKSTTEIPLSELHGVGEKIGKNLNRLGLFDLSDLIWYFPRHHEDLSKIVDVIDVEEGQKVTIRVKVEKIQARRAWKRRMNITEALVGDMTASIKAIWFNQAYVGTSLKIDDEVFLSGVAKKSKYGLALQSPVFEKIKKDAAPTHTARIVPQYSLTRGLTQKQLRYFMKQALERIQPVTDYLPDELVTKHGLLPLAEALQQIHFPDSLEAFEAARKRHDFDQLFLIQLYSLIQRADIDQQKARAQTFFEQEIKDFVASLPFTLTDAQKQAAWAILGDLQQGKPMNRLLIGDVGSGKTIVAAMALYNTVLNGQQAALMAPTEILAKQHFESLTQLFSSLEKKIIIELMTGSTKNKTAGATAKSGQSKLDGFEADIIVGTHALIQQSVQFSRLGLAVVDEQHRFGVNQRRTIKQQSGDTETLPHLLSMTATPIPRTLALALYGDLDLSLMKEMPIGRKPVVTKLVPPGKRPAAYKFIQKHVDAAEQCFVICPLIDPSDKLGVKSVTSEYEHLQKEIFPNLSIGMLHGKMKPDEKSAAMADVQSGKTNILVATSVIEVGVDIPNATIIIIEGAERFGLAQLHQFRGRVGRSDKQSYCLLFTDSNSASSLDRLQALTTSNDGFALAEQDLAIRGAGEVFGTLQSGFSDAAVIAYQQPELTKKAKTAAEFTLEQNLIDQNPLLQKKLNDFIKNVHLE